VAGCVHNLGIKKWPKATIILQWPSTFSDEPRKLADKRRRRDVLIVQPLAVRRIFLARQSEFGSHAPVYQFREAATKLSIKDVFEAVRALTH